MRYAVCVVLGMLSLAGPAGAQDMNQQWAWCLNKDSAVTADQSLAGCTAVIQADRETPEKRAIAFRSRGNAYADKGQSDRAIEDYDKALRMNPKDDEAHYKRGNVYLVMGQYDRAIEDYDQAIRLYPAYALAFNNRGIAWRRKGQHARAIQDYDQLIRLKPRDAGAFVNRGIAYATLRQYDRAIEDYDQALRLNPDYAEAYYVRGDAWRHKARTTARSRTSTRPSG